MTGMTRSGAVLSAVDRVLPSAFPAASPPTLRSDATVTAFLQPIIGMLDDSRVNELCVNRPG